MLGPGSVASDTYDEGGAHKSVTLAAGVKLPDSQMLGLGLANPNPNRNPNQVKLPDSQMALVKEEMAARDKHR